MIKKTRNQSVSTTIWEKNSKFWVVSNYIKHLEKFHQLQSDEQRKSANKKNQTNAIESPNIQQSIEIHPDNQLTINNIDRSNEQQNDLVSFYYNQISTQMNQMLSTSLLNSENLTPVEFKYRDTSIGIVKVVNIDKDGNCLFGALSHQLFQKEANSISHTELRIKLRADVVTHIYEDFKPFKAALNGRITDHGIECNETDDEYKCFLDEKLSKDKYWGGSETLKAVSRMYRVNIFVFYEKGSCEVMHDVKQRYDNSIAVAYRIGKIRYDGDKEVFIRDHYDSVCDISSNHMYNSAQQFAITLTQNNDSIISID